MITLGVYGLLLAVTLTLLVGGAGPWWLLMFVAVVILALILGELTRKADNRFSGNTRKLG